MIDCKCDEGDIIEIRLPDIMQISSWKSMSEAKLVWAQAKCIGYFLNQDTEWIRIVPMLVVDNEGDIELSPIAIPRQLIKSFRIIEEGEFNDFPNN